MAKYKVDLIEPGTTSNEFGTGVEVIEEELRKAVDTLEGISVYNSDKDRVVGEVIDSTYEESVQCTVEIGSAWISMQLDEQNAKIAPVFVYNHSNADKPPIFFTELAVVPKTDPLVGNVERVEDRQWLYSWE